MNAQSKPFDLGAKVSTPHGEGAVHAVLSGGFREVKMTKDGNYVTFHLNHLRAYGGPIEGVGGVLYHTSASMNERKGTYMHTSSGRKYWPMDPRADEVEIEVIAHHLAMKCRYAGAVKDFYSVAEHSVYVALDLALQGSPIEIVKTGLLHDAAEAYIGDLIRPLKGQPEFAAFKDVEHLNEKVIAEKFGLTFPWHPDVKASDEAVTDAEVSQIIVKDPAEDWEIGRLHDNKRCAPFAIGCLQPIRARELFLSLWNRLVEHDCPRTVQGVSTFLGRHW
jgi:hypothetical protein